jgi:exonuclease I
MKLQQEQRKLQELLLCKYRARTFRRTGEEEKAAWEI